VNSTASAAVRNRKSKDQRTPPVGSSDAPNRTYSNASTESASNPSSAPVTTTSCHRQTHCHAIQAAPGTGLPGATSAGNGRGDAPVPPATAGCRDRAPGQGEPAVPPEEPGPQGGAAAVRAHLAADLTAAAAAAAASTEAALHVENRMLLEQNEQLRRDLAAAQTELRALRVAELAEQALGATGAVTGTELARPTPTARRGARVRPAGAS
jgi:hypothetical protein